MVTPSHWQEIVRDLLLLLDSGPVGERDGSEP
jgi:hypothetical protein